MISAHNLVWHQVEAYSPVNVKLFSIHFVAEMVLGPESYCYALIA